MKVIYSDAGNTDEVIKLRLEIDEALQYNDSVLIKLLQPGIMYQTPDGWHTVVDFMNEWEGKPVCFHSNLVPLKECKVDFEYTNDMFMTGPLLYQKNEKCKELLSSLKPPHEKTNVKLWDLLLGEKSDNKDLLFSLIKDHAVKNKTFLTYYGRDTNRGHWTVLRPAIHTAETINDPRKTQIRFSDLIDPDIYNQTQYSAIIETTVHNDFAMFSEKVAKPLIAKRPFVIFGSRRHLYALKSLGFKTFGDVIDESYDDIKDKTQRWCAVLEAMHKLTQQNPITVNSKLESVLAHNKKHFERAEWKRAIKWDSYQ